MNRTIVIGDLHGCYEETCELLDAVKATENDRVIFLGDLVDRGPDNDKCVDLVMLIEKRQGSHACVLGNHESKHIFYENIRIRNGKVDVVIPTHAATRAQLRAEHYDYFRSLPHYIRLPEYNAIVVHAGMWPGRSVEQQTHSHLLHIQSIDPDDMSETSLWPSKVRGRVGHKFWTNFYTGSEKIIFGHSVLDKPLVTDKVIGIDGGAVFGRALHALILPAWQIVSVTGKMNHGKGYRGRDELGKSTIKTYPAHGDVSTFS